jgi:predicted RND superfamily exporter protein
MDRIARFIVAHARPVLALTAIVSLAAALMLFRMDFNADVASFVLEGNETGEAFTGLQDKYATADPINVVATIEGEGSFREKAGLVALAELRDDLAAIAGVDEVASIVPEVNPITGEPLTVEDIGAAPDAAIGAVIAQNPVASLLLDDEGANTLLLVIPAGDALDVARSLDQLDPPDGIELTLSGKSFWSPRSTPPSAISASASSPSCRRRWARSGRSA